jgi:NAD(P)-dependent dehydrogenase (short-subunit alcohol dehydrogenase family)
MAGHDWPPPTSDALATGGAPWLEGKVALIAGGGLSGPEGGVGFGIAWLAARNAARVAVLDHDADAASRTVTAIRDAGGEAEAFPVDVTDDAAVSAAVDGVQERFGRIDVVADSIGGRGLEAIFEATPDEWDIAMDLNVVQAWSIMRHAQRHLMPGGAIVTISSGAVDGRGPGLPYGVAKAALEKLTIGAAGSLAPRGIRANVVRVGMIWGAFAARGMTEAQRELRRTSVALQTEGNVWDIASAAMFLLTDQSRWISGQVLSVDGGGFLRTNTGSAGEKRKDV